MGTGPARMVFIALAARLAPGPVISGDTEAVLALSQQSDIIALHALLSE